MEPGKANRGKSKSRDDLNFLKGQSDVPHNKPLHLRGGALETQSRERETDTGATSR